jgi:twitching motility protein PilI
VETSTGTRFGTLQSFQQQLAQRLQHAQLSPGNTQAYLACATSMQRWLFDLAHAEAILSGEQPTKVPFTRHWYLGLISHRGQLIGVIDLDGFAGAEPRPWQRGDRLLVLSSVLPLRCAIRVTHMIGVIDQAHLCRADPTTNSPSWAAHSFTHHDGSHYLGVDLAALMATPSFLDIAQYQA